MKNPRTGRTIIPGGPTHRRLMRQQRGGNSDFNLWWDEVNGALGLDEESDKHKDEFFKDLLQVAGGKPVSKNAFIIAHAMWHGNGDILPGVFGDNESQLAAINEAFDDDFTYVDAFIEDYLHQSEMTVTEAAKAIMPLYKKGENTGNYDAMFEAMLQLLPKLGDRRMRLKNEQGGSGCPTHRRLMGQQRGGNSDFKLWWDEVNDELGMDEESNKHKDEFFKDLLQVAGGKPVSKNAFIIAHAMWHGNGDILPGVFGDNESQLAAINEAFDTDFTDVDGFIEDYLHQNEMTVTKAAELIMPLYKIGENTGNYEAMFEAMQRLMPSLGARRMRLKNEQGGSGCPTHRRLMGQQRGGNSDFKLWWDEVNDELGMDEESDKHKDEFFKDLLQVAGGKPVSRNAFIIAHAMWHGNGNILPGVFGDNESQLAAINEAFGTNFTDVDDFIEDYLHQNEMTVTKAAELIMPLYKIGEKTGNYEAMFEAMQRLVPSLEDRRRRLKNEQGGSGGSTHKRLTRQQRW